MNSLQSAYHDPHVDVFVHGAHIAQVVDSFVVDPQAHAVHYPSRLKGMDVLVLLDCRLYNVQQVCCRLDVHG